MQAPFKKFLHGLLIGLPRWTPASEAPFVSTQFYFFVLVVQRVERFSVSVLHAHNRRAGNCIGLLSNSALLLPTDNKLCHTFKTT